MKRVGFEMKIKTKSIKEYKEWHANVWPEMLDALRKMVGKIILFFKARWHIVWLF